MNNPSRQYYCHQCEAEVSIAHPTEELVCPICGSEFLEERVGSTFSTFVPIPQPSLSSPPFFFSTNTLPSADSGLPNPVRVSFHITAFPSPRLGSISSAGPRLESSSQPEPRVDLNTTASTSTPESGPESTGPPIASLMNWVLQGMFGGHVSTQATDNRGSEPAAGHPSESRSSRTSSPASFSSEERRRPRSPSLSEEAPRSTPANPSHQAEAERRHMNSPQFTTGSTSPSSQDPLPMPMTATASSFEQLFELVNQLIAHPQGMTFVSSAASNMPISELLSSMFQMPDTIGDYAVGPNAFDNIITRLMETEAMQVPPLDSPFLHLSMLHDIFSLFRQHAPPPASEHSIQSLSQFKMDAERLQRVSECAVCREHYQLEDAVIELPCLHFFHHDCILPWLRRNGTCPVCRYKLESQS